MKVNKLQNKNHKMKEKYSNANKTFEKNVKQKFGKQDSQFCSFVDQTDLIISIYQTKTRGWQSADKYSDTVRYRNSEQTVN